MNSTWPKKGKSNMSRNAKKNKHHGGDFDDFLKEEGIYEKACATAAKRVIAARLREIMEEKHISITKLALMMDTKRPAINRLLDENNYALSLRTLSRAAAVLGKTIRVELV
jgi:antitoxin HicB